MDKLIELVSHDGRHWIGILIALSIIMSGLVGIVRAIMKKKDN